jgi:hypothetical protein
LKDFVQKGIKELFFSVDHNIEEERLGCARGLGQTSAIHTDPVLTHLQTILKTQTYSSSWLSFGSTGPKPTDVTIFTKATAILTYGFVSMLIPSKLI